jgi:hypothetical protein
MPLKSTLEKRERDMMDKSTKSQRNGGATSTFRSDMFGGIWNEESSTRQVCGLSCSGPCNREHGGKCDGSQSRWELPWTIIRMYVEEWASRRASIYDGSRKWVRVQ